MKFGKAKKGDTKDMNQKRMFFISLIKAVKSENTELIRANMAAKRNGDKIIEIYIMFGEREDKSDSLKKECIRKVMKNFEEDEYFLKFEKVVFKFMKQEMDEEGDCVQVILLGALFNRGIIKETHWENVDNERIIDLGEEIFV